MAGELRIAGESIRIHELLEGDSILIENRLFEDCEIIGPAIIFPMYCTFIGGGFGGDLDAVLWEVPFRRITEIRSDGTETTFDAPTFKIGLIGVRNCTFRNCRFRAIGVAGPPPLIQEMRQAAGEPRNYAPGQAPPTSNITQLAAVSPLKVFISYSHKDEVYRRKLEEHLAVLRNTQYVEEWHDRKIGAGEEWRDAIDRNLEDADIILLLVSSSFLASDYINQIELARALSKHERREARVIPVIVKDCEWQQTRLARLQALPDEGKPIANRGDKAWVQVTRGLRRAIDQIQANRLMTP